MITLATRDDSGVFETEAFLEYVKLQVETLGKTFTEPDDDWIPIFLFERKEGFGLLPVNMPEQGSIEKEVMFAALAEVLSLMKPIRIAFVASGWTLPTPERAKEFYDGGGGAIANEPDRVEILFVHVADRNYKCLLRTEIERDGINPPKLGEWERFDAAGGGVLDGKIVDVIDEALR